MAQQQNSVRAVLAVMIHFQHSRLLGGLKRFFSVTVDRKVDLASGPTTLLVFVLDRNKDFDNHVTIDNGNQIQFSNI